MATPFPVNATLTFQVPTGDLEIDEHGNPLTAVQALVVTAYLREPKSRSKSSDSLNAGDISRLSLEGRIDTVTQNGVQLEPAALPSTIQPGAKAIAVISDPGGINPDLTGEFYLEASAASAFGTSATLGSPIRGYLLSEVIWGTTV